MRYGTLAISLAALSSLRCSSTPATSKSEERNADHPVLVCLEGRSESVVIKAGPTAPLYSVLSSNGQVLVREMTLTELAAHDAQLHDRVKSAIAAQALTHTPKRSAVRLAPARSRYHHVSSLRGRATVAAARS